MKTSIFLLLSFMWAATSMAQTTRYVKQDGTGDGSSWVNASSDLQAMITASSANDQIWVAAGTYKPTATTTRTISFVMKNGVALYGGFNGTETLLSQRNWLTNITILSGNIGDPNNIEDNSLHVINNTGLNGTAILDGFTITGGCGNQGAAKGAGMYNVSSSPTISNCKFIANHGLSSPSSGGGMCNENSSSPTITNCIISGNSSTSGGGMTNLIQSHPIINQCILEGNFGSSGGMMYNLASNPVLTNCRISGNSSLYGATFYNAECAPGLINCTVAENFNSYGGNIYNNYASTTNIKNSILWNNVYNNSTEIADYTNSLTTVTYSDVQGGFTGVGNINSNPLFISNTNFHLQGCSPVIDVATNTGAPVVDFDNNMRPFNTTGLPVATTDMGAYEYQTIVTYVTCYADTDSDGYGNVSSSQYFCLTCGSGFVSNSTDCNDGDSAIHPGATEICDSKDNDCDGQTDEGHERLYVKSNATGANNGSSWTDAFTDLQSALNLNCLGANQIWVAAGTYKPTTTSTRTISFNMKNGVAIYGGFNGTETLLSQRNWITNVTILSGDIGTQNNASDNSIHVVFNSNLNNTAILDGFTIRDGNATINPYPSNSGAGMYNSSSSPTLRNCTFTSNSANTDGGGILNYASSPVILSCIFTGNTSLGPGGGGAMFNEANPTTPSVTNCTFSGNSAVKGGAMYNSGNNATVTNCIFLGNLASYGGGAIFNWTNAATPVYKNCTFSGNQAAEGGAVRNEFNANPTFTNCVIWGNSSGITHASNSGGTVSYSLVQNGFPGIGNINEDPLFVSQPPIGLGTIGNLQLLTCSPAVDLGTNSGAPTTDFDGNIRPFNSTGTVTAMTDMGAFEFQSTFTVFSWYADIDHDDYGNVLVRRCTAPANYYPLSELSGNGTDDCNDNDNTVNPGATEICDLKDNDCDGLIDEGNVCCPANNIIYVKSNATGNNTGTSWTNAFTDLQSALNLSCPGTNQIWVASGTYKPTTTTNRAISFVLKNNLALYGGFAGTETLLSQRNWSVNVTTLSGNLGQPQGTDNSYHVVYSTGLNNTAIVDGFTILSGYGNQGASNSKGAGMYNVSSSPTVTNCIFMANYNFENGGGGGMCNENSSSPIVTKCTFTGNLGTNGGAMYNLSNSAPVIRQCNFDGNYSNYGGAMCNISSNAMVTNCKFVSNQAYNGGGLLNIGGSPGFTNCTFTNNLSTVDGAINNTGGSTPIFKNCILWGNTIEITNVLPSTCTVTYSDIQGGYTGSGNLNIDPLFVDGSNLHLQACSPVIDVATNTGAPTTDFDGNTRPFNATGTPTALTDMGAYESQSPLIYVTCYADTDNDNYGNVNSSQVFCTTCATGYVSNHTDCNDTNPDIHPGAVEICDGLDNDCDNSVDEGSVCCPAPVAVCVSITVYLNAAHNFTVLATDINGGSIGCGLTSYINGESLMTFYCEDVGPNVVTLTVTDFNNISSTCTATVTVTDELNPCCAGPTAECKPFTLNLNASGTGSVTPADINNGSTYPCGLQGMSVTPNSFTCTNLGPNPVTLTVTDINGISSTCIATVTVVDNIPPVAHCQNITVNLDTDGAASILGVQVDNNSTDACGITSRSVTPDLFNCDDVGANTVTLTVSDANGNSSTCTSIVTVADITPPTAICQDVTLSLDEFGTVTLPGTGELLDGGSSDICGVASFNVSQYQFSCADVGGNSVMLTVTDVNGNSVTCNSTVTIVDDVAPEVHCQDITVELDATGNISIDEHQVDNVSTDACGIASMVLTPASFTCDNIGDHQVTLTVTDESGNISSCQAMVTILDKSSPDVHCQDVTVQLDDEGQVSINIDQIDNGSTDACGIDSRSVIPGSFTCDEVGDNPVTMTVTDVNGNISTCSAIVTVEDNVLPVAYCKDITVNLDASGEVSIVGDQVDNFSTDACGIVSRIVTPNTFSCENAGENVVTLTVTDVNGNSSACQSTVTVNDVTPPIAVCQNTTLQLDENGDASFSSSAIVFYDYSCDRNTVVFSDVSQSFIATSSGYITRISAGIGDWQSPLHYTTIISSPSNTVNYGSLLYSGRCCYNECVPGNNMGYADLPYSFYVNEGETITISFSGNSGDMHYQDNQLRMYVTGELPGAAVLDGGSTDACGAVSFSASQIDFNCEDVGTNTVTLTVTDIHGNTSTCNSMVTVEDNISPEVHCQNMTVDLDNSGNISITVDQVDNGSSDACGIASRNISQNSFTCEDIGENTVTLTVTDENGNSNTCLSTVTVEDNTAPEAICHNVTISLDAYGHGSINASQINNGSVDACGIGSVSVSPNAFNSDDIGENVVVLTVTDMHGNVASCTAVVTVIDNIAPTINCPASISTQYNPASCTQVSVTNPTTSDNTGVTNLTWVMTGATTGNSPSSGINYVGTRQFNFGVTTIRYTAMDMGGNTSTCSFTITVTPKVTSSTISYSPALEQQYSDAVTFTATITGGASAASCNPLWKAAQSATFYVGTQVMGNAVFVAVGTNLVATLSNTCLLEGVNGQMSPGTKSVTATFNSIDANHFIVNPPAPVNLKITAEDANIVYNGQEYFSTLSPTNCTGVVTLSTYVGDVNDTPVNCRGDIRKANITFSNGGIPGTTLGTPNLPVGLINPNNINEGIAINVFEYTLQGGECSSGGKTFEVWMKAGNYYKGETNEDEVTLVTLALPGNDFVSGGGHLVLSNSAGTYAGTAGSNMHFGFNMKWNNGGNNLQGAINIIFRKLVNGVWRTYQIKSNKINSMVVNNADPQYRKAIISTKANLQDITDSQNPISLGGNLNLAMDAWESTIQSNGSLDKIGVTLTGSGSTGLLFSSHWVSSGTVVQFINKGHIKVRSGSGPPQFAILPSDTPEMTLEDHQIAVNPTINEEETIQKPYVVYNQPNPFNDQTLIKIELERTENLSLRVYNNVGQLVAVLNEGLLEPGSHTFTFQAGNLPDGVYIYTVSSGSFMTSGRMMHIR